MRKLLLLLGGFGGAMAAAWLLVVNACGILTDTHADNTVILLEPAVQTLLQEEVNTGIQLPYMIPGTDLVAEQLCAYEGPYLEDGSDDEVTDVAALLLRNTGKSWVELAQVKLCWEQGMYIFKADNIPSEEAVLVLAQNRNPYEQQEWTDCNGWQCTVEGESRASDDVAVQTVDMGTVTVTNTTDRELQNIRLYYKSYLSPPDIYVGGITYKVGIQQLAPGQSVQLSPYHYASGYSEIIKVTHDDCE